MIAPLGPAATGGDHRVPGVDVARALAVIGMFAIHFNLAGEASVVAGRADAGGRSLLDLGVVTGPAAVSIGFVMVAGVGLGLASSTGPDARTDRRLLTRAVVLLPLGLALQELFPDGVSVILQNFALLFLVAPWLRRRGDGTLLGVAALSIVGGAVLHMVLEAAHPGAFEVDQTRLLSPPWPTVRGLLLTGAYPVVEFLGPFALGCWMGRRDLLDRDRQRRWSAVALATGAAATLVGLVARAVVAPGAPALAVLAADISIESKSLLWLGNGIAWQTVILIACLWAGRSLPTAVSPLAAMGRMSLSVYVLHLLVIAAAPDVMRTTSLVGAGARALVFTAVVVPVAVVWLRRFGRGPLERGMDALSRGPASPRPPSSHG
ncbi:MAG: DUF418 domain-containing protein [Actinobacteria bacterium]|nr:DUF418 domain-containing protein [Actinomycetota bacterium]